MNPSSKNIAGQVNDLEVLAAQFLVRQELRHAHCHLSSIKKAVLLGSPFVEDAKRRFEIATKAVQFAHAS